MNIKAFALHPTYSPVIVHLGTDIGRFAECTSIPQPSKRCALPMPFVRRKSVCSITEGQRTALDSSETAGRRIAARLVHCNSDI